jgi:hypothetical protein
MILGVKGAVSRECLIHMAYIQTALWGVKSADLLSINKDAKHSFRTILNSCSLLYFLLTNTIVFISSI